MSKVKKKRILIVLSVFAVLFVFATGYAAYTANLKLNANYKVSENGDVQITNISTKQLGGHAINDPNNPPKFTGTTATFNTKLYLPGDYAEYNVTVTNAGNIDVYLKELVPADDANPAIKFSYKNLDAASQETLKANSTKTFVVRIEYDINVTEQPTELTSSYDLTLNFEQKA